MLSGYKVEPQRQAGRHIMTGFFALRVRILIFEYFNTEY